MTAGLFGCYTIFCKSYKITTIRKIWFNSFFSVISQKPLYMNRFQFKGIYVFLLFTTTIQSFSQDILFIKDSGRLQAYIIDFSGLVVAYRLPGEPDSKTHYLSKSEIDSLHYGGKSLHFNTLNSEVLLKTKRNYLNTELINSISGKLNIDYERISENGRTGLIAGLLVNLKPEKYDYWDDNLYGFNYSIYSPHYFFFRFGINFYPFNHSLVREKNTRFSTGFSLLTGSYRKLKIPGNYYDYSNGPDTEPSFAASLMWNIRERIFIGDRVQLNGGLEISILPLLVFFCPQVGLSIGF